ncbi:MAG: exopolyphosphatase [Deltaproteobacteria bacterium]|nr:exopolyphosphatase [Deltaproteobacteria bacterium]MBW2481090.1 exopolyphosphatase [Deltaproteobacteria bacterium]
MRIVTRPDFDGIVCAVLLYEAMDIMEPVKWVEPNAMQGGMVDIRKGDIIANLPYDDRCSFWFDHHYTNRIYRSFNGVFKIAPSAAGIIFNHYKDRFKSDYEALVSATDKIDAADLSEDEVLHPEKHDYVMLSMTVVNGGEPDEPYWNRLVDLLRHYDIQHVLDVPDVKERCRRAIEQNDQYAIYLKKNTRLEKHVSITDFRNLKDIPAGNRFLVYSLFPDSFVNLRIRYEKKDKGMTAVNIGHSIFNRRCNVNAGLLLADFGGGGHRGAASTRFESSHADTYLPQIIDALQKNENNENC